VVNGKEKSEKEGEIGEKIVVNKAFSIKSRIPF
jgi:hypothetical protein